MSDPSESPDAGAFPFHRDNWVSKALVVVFVLVPLAAFAYALWALWGDQVGWLELGLLAGMWTFTGLGISIGFHRMLTHRSIVARAHTRAVALIAGTMSMQGHPADWAATHIRHHAMADREGDPHSPLEGFWHAHFGWLLRDRFVRSGVAHDKIMADPVVAFVQKTWVLWATIGMVIPGLVALAFEPTLASFASGILWGGLVRVFIGHHITWSVNSLGHMIGTRPFANHDRATNSWLLAIFSWGEGWHNNHHAFPRSGYIGLRWYQVDIAKYVLVVLKWVGQVRHIHVPTRAEMQARLRRNRRLPARSRPTSS
jgi:stearoyl-CoA desaturase (Delta-9 desaturase)